LHSAYQADGEHCLSPSSLQSTMDSARETPGTNAAPRLDAFDTLHTTPVSSRNPNRVATPDVSETARRFPLIVHCHLRWDFVWQRPQQLFSRLAAHHAVLFVEDPLPTDGEAGLDISEPYANVVRLVPRLPHGAPQEVDAQWRVLLPLIERALAE